MTTTKIETYHYLKEFSQICVKITDELFRKIKITIKHKYGSLYKYNNNTLKIKYVTLKKEFRSNQHHNFKRLLQISKDADMDSEEFLNNILGFYHTGSHNKYIKIPRYIEINQFFVEGYALYLAEGDNGSNGKIRPRKFRFTNSEVSVINLMIRWLDTYFPNIIYYVNVIYPKELEENEINTINCEDLRSKHDSYNKQIKYRICCDSAILIDLFLSVKNMIKNICSKDKNLACAYIRGMMIGEGTVYNNRMKYVRIEMRNEEEIKYIHQLLTMLGYECKTSLRTTRQNMWSIYIGAKQLKKYYSEIGFGIHEKRQRILRQAIKKSV